MEFTAVAVVVVGGVSLFGGRGSIIPGVLLGALTFQLIVNGLKQMSANPYVYKLITGAGDFPGDVCGCAEGRAHPRPAGRRGGRG